MTDEGTPQASPNLTDDEILKRADMINEARKLEQEEKERQIEEEKAKKAAEAERILKEQEAEKAAKLAEAERVKKEEEAKKAEELRRAHELVNADKSAKPKKKHTAAKIILAIVVILIIFCGLAIVSSSVTSTSASTSTSLPYTTHYTIYLPQGTTNIAGLSIMLTGDATQMMVTMPGMPTVTLSQGQSVTLGPNKITVTLFWGAWKIYEITYKTTGSYMGVSNENLVTFDTYIQTDKQIPESLLNAYLSLSGIKYTKAS
ncbi:MAG TPA: hypothetical protein O0X50_00145 [Methanocorpusculum sp.]|nr:hypothetical protein [Methanocorpusculum sp.]